MFKEEELMDIIRFKAGFGNQMFQYAFLLELQERGRNVKGYLGFYDNSNIKYMLQEVFPNINIEMVDDQIFRKRKEDYDKILHSRIKYRVYKYIKRARKYWMEESDGKYDANVFKTKNCVFVGYWETEKYFSHVKDKVRQAY